MVVLRLAWMYTIPALVPPIRRRLPEGQIRNSWREQLILGWSGMRGALSLAAALSLPVVMAGHRLADRGLIVFLAFVAILVTLVLPGLTLVPLIRVLRLGQSEQALHQSLEARISVVRAALTELDRAGQEGEYSERALARLRELYESRIDALERRLSPEHDDEAPHVGQDRELRRRAIRAQRDALQQLAGKRAAPVSVIQDIERDLDLDSARLSQP
jgi:CPA1 family monovalent cation:H+ antiporter